MKRLIVAGLASLVVLTACGVGGKPAVRSHAQPSFMAQPAANCFKPDNRFQLYAWLRVNDIVDFKTAPSGSSFPKVNRPLCTPLKVGVTWYKVSRTASSISLTSVASNNFLVDGRNSVPIAPKSKLEPGHYKLAVYREWASVPQTFNLKAYNTDVELGQKLGRRWIWSCEGLVH